MNEKENQPKVCVMGCGYIGLPTIAMFAKHGCEVVGVDVIPSVVETLNRGDIHIEEPGLAEIVREVVENGRFHASVVPEPADVFIIAVPTPNHNDEWLSCDLTYVLSAVQAVLPVLRKGNTVIVESTIAPRSMDDDIKPLLAETGFTFGVDLFLAHAPERVLPGKILYELTYNNRIVGGITPACADRVAQIYKIFVQGEIIKTEAKTAELSKCMENTFRDVNIALANELAKICDRLKINCLDVIEMANKHPRVNLLSPGPGVGGHCLAIDPYFICAKAPNDAKLIRLARDVNCSMPHFVVEKVEMLLDGIKYPKIAALGVTYKGNIDDRRESPAIEIIELLQKKGYQIAISDDHVNDSSYFSAKEAAQDADLLIVLTDHDEYKGVALSEVAEGMRRSMIFDTRNIVRENDAYQLVNYGSLYQFQR